MLPKTNLKFTIPRYVEYEGRFRLLLNEMAQLKKELAIAEQKIIQFKQEDRIFWENGSLDRNLSPFAEEIRKSLTAIIENAEVLLTENIGTLADKHTKIS